MGRVAKPQPGDVEAAADLLLCAPDGLALPDICRRLGMPRPLAEGALRVLRKTKRAVYFAPTWAAARHAARVTAARRQHAEAQRALRVQRYRAEGRYTFDYKLDRAPDAHVNQQVKTSWPPVRQAPGPTSVFDFGARHA